MKRIKIVKLLQSKTPIDHILVSKEFSVSSAVVGENVGSDHKPFIATVDFE